LLSRASIEFPKLEAPKLEFPTVDVQLPDIDFDDLYEKLLKSSQLIFGHCRGT
jgi:hypothetical protein